MTQKVDPVTLPPVYVAFELVADAHGAVKPIPVFVRETKSDVETFVERVRSQLEKTEFMVVRCIPGVVR